MKKNSTQKISVIQRKIWEHCKRLTRQNYGHTCYTCGSTGLTGSNWHTGHLWAKASLGAYLKYDLRVLRPQCYNCNINRGGMGADFYKKMLNEIGQEKMEQLEKDRQVEVRAYDFYVKLLEKYEKMAINIDNN
jgi:endonuclease I